VPLGEVLANAVIPEAFTRQEAAWLEQVQPATLDPLSADCLAAARSHGQRLRGQREQLARLRAGCGLPVIEVPFFAVGPGRDLLERVAAVLAREGPAAPEAR
jgi:hypothetical protein